jgi:hypothetical protein
MCIAWHAPCEVGGHDVRLAMALPQRLYAVLPSYEIVDGNSASVASHIITQGTGDKINNKATSTAAAEMSA